MPTTLRTALRLVLCGLCAAAPLTASPMAASPAAPTPTVPAVPQGQVRDPGAQGDPKIGDREGLTREQMWRAPTEEDWKKPVLIEWQRSYEDALEVSKETGKPLLICVNMDGEIASEHYAGIRYRQPEVAELFNQYVCLIASTYRHTPRDHDENGRRIPCPRFGGVTCGEHIHLEPLVFEKYLDGVRVSPRHIMVELDGTEVYDVYYTFDTASVFERVQQGLDDRTIEPTPIVRGDRTVVERVASRAAQDRRAVEKAWQEGDRDTRLQLLEAAIANADKDPHGLLRLAIQGFDAEFAAMAREALAQTDSTGATELIAEALSAEMVEDQRTALVAALDRIGTQSMRAKTLANAQKGMAAKSRVVDVEGWLAGASYQPASFEALAEKADAAAAAEAAAGAEARATARLDAALANLELAADPRTDRALGNNLRRAAEYKRLMVEDAARALEQAEELGASGWKLHAAKALVAHYRDGDAATAYAEAEKAMPDIPDAAAGWPALATIDLFAIGRRMQVQEAILAREDWPSEWLSDMDSAYQLIARHPLGTDVHVVTHYDFLSWMRAWRRAENFLQLGLERFPTSWLLHDRLRARVMRRGGVEGLRAAYDRMLEKDGGETPALTWFAAYAGIVAAEAHRRNQRTDEARAAYDAAIAKFGRAVELDPSSEANSKHYVAVCLAGKARMAWEAGALDEATDLVLRSFTTHPPAADALDGMNVRAVDTAMQLRSAAEEAQRTDLVARIAAGLGRLDPEQLRPAAYDVGGPPIQPNGIPQRRGNRGGGSGGGRGRAGAGGGQRGGQGGGRGGGGR